MTEASVNNALETTSHWTKAFRIISFALVGIFAQGVLAQTTTLLNFDDLADGTTLTTQYSSQGITASGVTILNALNLGTTSTHSSPNFAYAPNGLMSFNVSIANVKTVSAYITGPANVGIYAYDAGNNLVGSAISSSQMNNVFQSVTSSGADIARVDIHDGGATFFIDDLAFTTAPPPPAPTCHDSAEDTYNMIAALPASAYVRAKTAALDRLRLLIEVVEFEKLRASDKVSQKVLSAALLLIQADVKLSVKSPQNQPILQKLSEINSMIKSNSCQ